MGARRAEGTTVVGRRYDLFSRWEQLSVGVVIDAPLCCMGTLEICLFLVAGALCCRAACVRGIRSPVKPNSPSEAGMHCGAAMARHGLNRGYLSGFASKTTSTWHGVPHIIHCPVFEALASPARI
jgi:hypothetical protein